MGPLVKNDNYRDDPLGNRGGKYIFFNLKNLYQQGMVDGIYDKKITTNVHLPIYTYTCTCVSPIQSKIYPVRLYLRTSTDTLSHLLPFSTVDYIVLPSRQREVAGVEMYFRERPSLSSAPVFNVYLGDAFYMFIRYTGSKWQSNLIHVYT